MHLQNERRGNDGNFAAFLVNSIRMQPDAGSIRIFLMGAFLASIGVELVVNSLLGRQTALQSCCDAVLATRLSGCCTAPLVPCCHKLQTYVRGPAPSLVAHDRHPPLQQVHAASTNMTRQHSNSSQQVITR